MTGRDSGLALLHCFQVPTSDVQKTRSRGERERERERERESSALWLVPPAWDTEEDAATEKTRPGRWYSVGGAGEGDVPGGHGSSLYMQGTRKLE